MKLNKQSEAANAKQEYKYWSDYYDRLLKQAAEKHSSLYH